MSDIKGTIAGGAVGGKINIGQGKDGKSAYEIALANGFKGTEAEWLESLKAEADKTYVQKENLIKLLEPYGIVFASGKGNTNASYTRTQFPTSDNGNTSGQINLTANKTYNIELKEMGGKAGHVFMYGADGTYKGYFALRNESLIRPILHIVNGVAHHPISKKVLATDISYIHISAEQPDKTKFPVMVWETDSPEESRTEWLGVNEKPKVFYSTDNQMLSKKQKDDVLLARDKARFDNSFNYIAYSSVTGSEGAINTAKHYEWAAKQGVFSALKGDVRPTLDGELIMCHDAGFTLSTGGHTVTSDGYIKDASGNVVNEAYITKYYGKVKASYDATTGTYSTTDEIIEPVSGGTKVTGVTTTEGYQLYSATVNNETIYYVDILDTFPIENLCKEQCLALKHLGRVDNYVCDFDTYIRTCKKYGKIAFITIRDKYITEIVVPKMLEVLDKYNMRKNCIINSFTHSTLKIVRQFDDNIMLSQVIQSDNELKVDYINNAINLGVCLICCYDSVKSDKYEALNKAEAQAAIALARAYDIRLYEAIVDDATDIDKMLEYGIVGAQMEVVPNIATLPSAEEVSY